MSSAVDYHTGSIAKTVERFRSIPEGNGTMLDNATIVYTGCAGVTYGENLGQVDPGLRDLDPKGPLGELLA